MVRSLKKLVNRIRKLAKGVMLSTASLIYRVLGTPDCYTCPICNYRGRFRTEKAETEERINAQCPKCGSLERHRLQHLVFEEISRNMDTRKMSMLHFAPEAFFSNIFRKKFGVYVTADLSAPHVDRNEDLTRLSFADKSFDFLYASHVLEHVKDDMQALSEIRRVLKKGGTAIIPVPIVCQKTVEYSQPNPHEYDHVRRPGKDYYKRYDEFFEEVRIYQSKGFDEKYQLYACKIQTNPNATPGSSAPIEKWPQTVPVCLK